MKVTNTSQYSGKTYTMDLDITPDQWAKYCCGEGFIQDIFPNLTPGEREFIKTGITDEEWTELFG